MINYKRYCITKHISFNWSKINKKRKGLRANHNDKNELIFEALKGLKVNGTTTSGGCAGQIKKLPKSLIIERKRLVASAE